ncbi:cupin domain-containing protein [Jiangella ureilytica]|uniref:Cupin domain-containing protein n=1 Tax=Jiangella ureilytica TaxID=2530374 RepID=A0A4R4RS07_9ACTN|nr:cupin domain-containing protein [Jiangella ureilytica]TDC52791.1 cupin domain-containing protein [Jiangella ureilytica]
MSTIDNVAEDFPEELEHTATGLEAQGLIARQVATHEVAPLPDKPQYTCRLDRMGGNSMLAMHLAEIQPGGYKCNHRHLDETLAYVISGRGRTEMRQSDYTHVIVTEWEAGDVVVIPANAWHRHVNADSDEPARQLSFRNTPLMNRILHGGGGTYTKKDRVYNGAARLPDRFDDELDFFTVREDVSPRTVKTNFIRQIADEELPASDPELGERASLKYFAMGGQLTLNVALVGIGAGGHVREHRPLGEESMLVLRGSGRTELRGTDGEVRVLTWTTGDVVCPPLGAVRKHVADTDVRLLKVRNVALERALDLPADEPTLDSALPDRLGDLAGGRA